MIAVLSLVVAVWVGWVACTWWQTGEIHNAQLEIDADRAHLALEREALHQHGKRLMAREMALLELVVYDQENDPERNPQ